MNARFQDIDRTEYPELNLLLWDRADRYISAKDAFQAYEQRWRYIDQNNILKDEQALIDLLVEEYGHGLMLTA